MKKKPNLFSAQCFLLFQDPVLLHGQMPSDEAKKGLREALGRMEEFVK